MLETTMFIKKKGERTYKKFSSSKMKNSSINDYLKFFPTSHERKNPDNIVSVKYTNFGRTFTRVVKNTRTGNSKKLILKEKW